MPKNSEKIFTCDKFSELKNIGKNIQIHGHVVNNIKHFFGFRLFFNRMVNSLIFSYNLHSMDDILSKKDNSGKETPTPRPRQRNVNSSDKSSSVYENYELRINDRSNEIPVPAPRQRYTQSSDVVDNKILMNPLNNISEAQSIQRPTGAIRKIPIKNNLAEKTSGDSFSEIKNERDFDVISQTSSNSISSGNDKFQNPSPG